MMHCECSVDGFAFAKKVKRQEAMKITHVRTFTVRKWKRHYFMISHAFRIAFVLRACPPCNITFHLNLLRDRLSDLAGSHLTDGSVTSVAQYL